MEQATLRGPGDVGGLPVRTLWRFALYNAADRVVLFLFAVAALPRSDFLRSRKTESPRAVGACHTESVETAACLGRAIQALPLPDAFPIARWPRSKPTASTHPW